MIDKIFNTSTKISGLSILLSITFHTSLIVSLIYVVLHGVLNLELPYLWSLIISLVGVVMWWSGLYTGVEITSVEVLPEPEGEE